MLTSKVAKRYAQGLLDFAKDQGNTQDLFKEMQEIRSVWDNSKELRLFLGSPIIEGKKKIAIAAEIFKSFSPTAKNLITLVIKQGRESHLRDIAQEYINKVEDENGVQRISLTVASELSQETIENILKTSSFVNLDKEYDLTTVIKPDILGGYILRVGDQQIDASVNSKLNQVRKEFQLN